jgi:hypothetical protein
MSQFSGLSVTELRNELRARDVKVSPTFSKVKLEELLEKYIADEKRKRDRLNGKKGKKRFVPKGESVTVEQLNEEVTNLVERVSIAPKDPNEARTGVGFVDYGNSKGSVKGAFKFNTEVIMPSVAVEALETRTFTGHRNVDQSRNSMDFIGNNEWDTVQTHESYGYSTKEKKQKRYTITRIS